MSHSGWRFEENPFSMALGHHPEVRCAQAVPPQIPGSGVAPSAHGYTSLRR